MDPSTDTELLPASQFPGNPPWHFQCRTVLIPVTKSWAELIKEVNPDSPLADVVKEMPESTRASMDGQVAGEQNYEDWLKTKPESFQKEVLGAGKHELWKQGKVTLGDMVDPTGRALTLSQLKARFLPETTLPAAAAGKADWKGYGMAELIRWAGSVGLSSKETRTFMTQLGLDPAQATIYIQLKKGKDGFNIPQLADEHLGELHGIVDAIRNGKPLTPPPKIEEPAPTIVPEQIVPPPSVTTATSIVFPSDPNKLKVVMGLGGSTGAELVEDEFGNRFVRKKGANADHVREEYYAERLYRAAGVPVPDSKLYEEEDGPVKLSQYIEGKTLDKLSGTERKLAEQQMRQHFAADALFADWDVTGANMDNVLMGKDGVLYRIDVGGSLRYRAQGALKGSERWNEHVPELWSLRDASKLDPGVGQGGAGKNNITVFGPLKPQELLSQVDSLVAKREAILAAAPAKISGIKDVLAQRFDSLDLFSKTSHTLINDKFTADYAVNDFTYEQMQIRRLGIVDKFPKQLKHTSGGSLVDENGKEHGGMRGANSPTKMLVDYVNGNGGDFDLVTKFAWGQASSSRNTKSEAVRAWFYQRRTTAPETYFWAGGEGTAGANAALQNLKSYGSEAKRNKTFAAFHAFNYEFMRNVEMPNSNRALGKALVMRTEPAASLYKLKAGTFVNYPRGMESTSIVDRFGGYSCTVTELPYTRAFGHYSMGYGRAGPNGGFLLGDGENEIFACINDLPTYVADDGASTSYTWAKAETKINWTSHYSPLQTIDVDFQNAKVISSTAEAPSYSPTPAYKPPVVKPQTYGEKLANAVKAPDVNTAKTHLGDNGIGFSKLKGVPGSLENFQSYKEAGGKAESYADFVSTYFVKDQSANQWMSKPSKYGPQIPAPGVPADMFAKKKVASFTASNGQFVISDNVLGTMSVGTTPEAKAMNAIGDETDLVAAYKKYVSAGGSIKSMAEWKGLYFEKLEGAPMAGGEPALTSVAPVKASPKVVTPDLVAQAKTTSSLVDVQTLLGDVDVDFGQVDNVGLELWKTYKKQGGKIGTWSEFVDAYLTKTDDGILVLKAGPKSAMADMAKGLEGAVEAAPPPKFDWADAKATTGVDWQKLGGGTIEDVYKNFYKVAPNAIPQSVADFASIYKEEVAATLQKNTKEVWTPAKVVNTMKASTAAQNKAGLIATQEQQLLDLLSEHPKDVKKAIEGKTASEAFDVLKQKGVIIPQANKEDWLNTWADAVEAVTQPGKVSLEDALKAAHKVADETAAKPKAKPAGANLPFEAKITKAKMLGNAFQVKGLLEDGAFPQSAGGGPLGTMANFQAYQSKGGKIATYADFLQCYFKEVEPGVVQIKLPASKVKTPPTKLAG